MYTIDVVDLYLDAMNGIPQLKKVLGLAQGHEGELGVIFIHAGVKGASDGKATHVGHDASRGEDPEGRRDHHLLAGEDQQMPGQFFAEYNPTAARGGGGSLAWRRWRRFEERMQFLAMHVAR